MNLNTGFLFISFSSLEVSIFLVEALCTICAVRCGRSIQHVVAVISMIQMSSIIHVMTTRNVLYNKRNDVCSI